MGRPYPVLSTFCGLAVLLIAAAASRAGTVWYVNAAASGSNSGTSWPNAFTNLQSALDVAQSGDEIRVAAGTYTPSKLTTPSDPRSATFQLNGGVSIYGGFAGGETTREERDWATHLTTLSADLLDNDDGTSAGSSDNCYRVVTVISTSTISTLDGFTVMAGNNTNIYHGGGGDFYIGDGGGIYVDRAQIEVRNCRIIGNYASSGGGLYSGDSSSNTSVVLDHCTFANNIANTGGGLYTSCNCTITDSVFQSNQGTSAAGAAYIGRNSSTPREVHRCRFVDNHSDHGFGGAVYMGGDGTLRLSECAFEGNTARNVGGAVLSYYRQGNLEIDRCTFDRNTSYDTQYEGGGAIMYEGILLTLSNSTFTNNTAWRGGGVRTQYSTAQIVNCRFLGNTSSDSGAAIYNRMSTVTVANCVISGNTATYGAAVRNSDSTVTLANCTATDNTNNSIGASVTADQGTATASVSLVNCILWGNRNNLGSDQDAQLSLTGGTWAVDYSCIQGWTGQLTGTGNIGTDPLFVLDDALGHLQPTSPCIDAGNTGAVPADATDLDANGNTTEPLPLDLDNAPRVKDDPFMSDTGIGSPAVVDMGCYEYFPDCDHNGIIDTCDFSCGEPNGPCDVPGCGQAIDCDNNGVNDTCDLDTDHDGLIDDCDTDDDNDDILDASDNCPKIANSNQADTDGDRVGDACDACPHTARGQSITPDGCPVDIPGDMDRDGDVDMSDFGFLQACVSGTGVAQDSADCSRAKLNSDNWVDRQDVLIFLKCRSGPGVPANPACAN